MSLREKIKFNGDKGILVITIVLSLISILAVFSSAKSTNVFVHHLVNLVLCFIGMFVAYKINYRALSRLALISLFVAGILLIVTLLFGNEERRGIQIGSMEIQTFYFIGFLVIFFIAKFLAVRIKNDSEMTLQDVSGLFIVVLFFTGGMALSNMSTAIIFFATSLAIMFLGNVRIKHLLLFCAVALFFGSIYLFGTDSGRSSTFRHRCHYYITNDNSEGYGDQMIKSKAAIARSGLLPAGPGQGVINKNLPEKDTDYVFTTVTEELGVTISLIILACYLILFVRSIKIAKSSEGPFGMLLAVGIGFWFCCQGLVHIGVNCGLLPATGQTLPFISRGGASLLFAGIATGVLLNISKQEA
ncbi:MAG: FtsW/RodA/SpoVE family cell cycle protein [Bacteroidales bacterium]|nr:FtsW/RodA/SpoVE family cell cycle protein [Bacteroidales bacterium]